MATSTYVDAQNYLQGTLDVGDTTLINVPPKGLYVVSLKFYNPAAYDITLSIRRAKQNNTVVAYTLTLDAGDSMEDTGYTLYPNDRLIVNTTVAGTNYFVDLKKYITAT